MSDWGAMFPTEEEQRKIVKQLKYRNLKDFIFFYLVPLVVCGLFIANMIKEGATW